LTLKEKMNSYKNIDKKILDVDEVSGTDVKINPDFYLHITLIKINNSFDLENMEECFYKYRHIVEHLEIICDSANILPDGYEQSVKEFSESKDYQDEKDSLKIAKMARFKLRLLLKGVFKHKPLSGPMKLAVDF
jgi:hypothetical protein